MKRKDSYSKRLLDPRWQRRKTEIHIRENFRCQVCLSNDKPVHVHHRYYVSGRKPWEYPDSALMLLCFECHERFRAVDGFEQWEDVIAKIEGGGGAPEDVLELVDVFEKIFSKRLKSDGEPSAQVKQADHEQPTKTETSAPIPKTESKQLFQMLRASLMEGGAK